MGGNDGFARTRANATQIQETITNLVVNARNAMPDGGTITISLKRVEIPEGARLVTPATEGSYLPPTGGTWVAIVVQDTGSSMPLDVIRRVFEPFLTTKRETKGTGLGLAQVYGIVRQHDGYVDLKSAVGVGTTFTVYLSESAENMQTDGLQDVRIVRGAGETVLIVEDDAIVLRAVSEMTDALGYNVIEAENGTEALAILRDQPTQIDIVLTEVVMPRISGAELARRAREIDTGLRVVMMTGHSLNEEDATDSESLQSKPVTARELANSLSF